MKLKNGTKKAHDTGPHLEVERSNTSRGTIGVAQLVFYRDVNFQGVIVQLVY